MRVWRINCKPGGQILTQKDQFNFWIEEKFVGIGWSSAEGFDEGFKRILNSDNEIKSIQNYMKEKMISERKSTRTFSTASNILVDRMKIEDYVWTRLGNIYKLGQIKSNGLYNFNSEKFEPDRQIGFYREVEYLNNNFSESEVPGKVVASYRARNTVQNVEDPDNLIETYCKACFSSKKYTVPIEKWFSILHSSDIEEVIGLYLQIEKKLYIYTSTNKSDTGQIEYELVDINGKHYGIQVKSGNLSLDANDYKVLSQKMKIYLFATSGDIRNLELNSNVEKIEIEDITKFMINFKSLLPERIKFWFR